MKPTERQSVVPERADARVVAQLVEGQLRQHFLNTAFDVNVCEINGGGENIVVAWHDGPTEETVIELIGGFHYPMICRDEGELKQCLNNMIITDRRYTADFLRWVADQMCENREFDHGYEILEVEQLSELNGDDYLISDQVAISNGHHESESFHSALMHEARKTPDPTCEPNPAGDDQREG